MGSNKRLIAINLPQYHPFKENDEWWGKGFTEWTNVVKARPRFKGHYQPHLPADTGFYDLRLPEARQMQADMAKKYGIYGFCYYHYWFNGKQLMERPVKEILSSGKPDFPFMLCWANENWTRAWDGANKEILIEQKYSEQDDIEHMEYLCTNVFNDPRYIRIGGKPFFILYNPASVPNLKRVLATWRETALKHGIELYLGYMRDENISKKILDDVGFDIHVDFHPKFNYCLQQKWWLKFGVWKNLFKEKILHKVPDPLSYKVDYNAYVDWQISCQNNNGKNFPGLTPSWDNSSRRKKGFWAFTNSTPQVFGKWLKHILTTFEPYSKEENFIFINAWNEWAEGNHLEPDQKWGLAYLEETKKQINLHNENNII